MDRTVVALVLAVMLPVVVIGGVYLIARRADRLTGAPVSSARMRKLARLSIVLGLVEVAVAIAILVVDRDVTRGVWFAALGSWMAIRAIFLWRQYRDVA